MLRIAYLEWIYRKHWWKILFLEYVLHDLIRKRLILRHIGLYQTLFNLLSIAAIARNKRNRSVVSYVNVFTALLSLCLTVTYKTFKFLTLLELHNRQIILNALLLYYYFMTTANNTFNRRLLSTGVWDFVSRGLDPNIHTWLHYIDYISFWARVFHYTI